MSDPVTTAEVEDVLSSIRRLVSEEKRPLHPAETPKRTDRLVLTPALRVQEDQPIAQDVATDIRAAFRSEHAESASFDDAAASLGPEVADKAISDTLAHTVNERADADASETLNLTSSDLADDYSDDPYDFDEFETDNVAVTLPPLTLEPELRSDAEWAADALAESEAVAESVKSAEETAEQAVEDVIAEENSMAATKAATLSAKIEALESAIGGIEGDFEPDEVSDDAYSGTQAPALAWEDDLDDLDTDDVDDEAVEGIFVTDLAHDDIDDQSISTEDMVTEIADDIADDTVTELHQPIKEAVFAAVTAEDASADEADFELNSETRLLDEDALRDMVGDIVRLELQGALGERITRNVRKLVRREIHRALTTQELD